MSPDILPSIFEVNIAALATVIIKIVKIHANIFMFKIFLRVVEAT